MILAFLSLIAVIHCIERPKASYTAPVRDDRTWSEFDEKGIVDFRGELIEETFRIGPFGPINPCAPGTDTQHCPGFSGQPEVTRPAPSERIEIAYWGDWRVMELVDGAFVEVPRGDLYFHHILAYSNGKFITGCSNERTTWGVDHLPYPYRQVLEPGAVVKASGFQFNNLVNRAITFYVQYKMLYKVHVPTDPAIRVVHSFYWMGNGNVPSTGVTGSEYTFKKNVRVPVDGVVVSMNGHLHQGGKTLTIRNKQTGEVICESRNVYNDDVECYWDCQDICPYQPHNWSSQWATTTCYMEKKMSVQDDLEMVSIYDSSCGWRAVMSWQFGFIWEGKTIGTA